MEHRFSEMNDEQLESLISSAEREAKTRKTEKERLIGIQEEKEAEAALANIDSYIAMCPNHTKYNGLQHSDTDFCNSVFTHYNYAEDIKCIRCYLLSCKEYATAPNFRLSLTLEKYQVYGK